MLKAVIFDMDGVIVDTEPFHAKISVKVLEHYDIPISGKDHYRFIGSTSRNMYETLIREAGMNLNVEDVLATDREIKKSLLKEEGYTPIQGVVELITDLYENGVKLAIASSSSPADIEEVVTALNIRQYFTHLISGSSLKNPKPAPDIFLLALEKLGIDAREAMVIEDSANGVNAALAANIPTIGFINPNSGNQDLKNASVLTESFLHINYNYVSDALKRANGEPITIAVTKRLIIHELSIEEIETMFHIYQTPEVRQYIHDFDGILELEVEKHKAYIKNIYGFYGYGLWGVYNRDGSKLIGRCGIENKLIDGIPEIELSYLLDKNHWGMGYALECTRAVLLYAAQVLEINRIVAVIECHNSRSIHVAERLGMTCEKEIVHLDRNCFLYSITNIEEVLKRTQASEKAKEAMELHPDASVYGKRY